MAVKMRLRRMGQKKAPFYRIVVADSRSPGDGRFIEEIGTYDPNREPSAISFNEEAAKKWLANGAQPTDIVAKLLKQAGIEKYIIRRYLVMKELVEVIAKSLVDNPSEVVVTETVSGDDLLLELKVDPSDMGKVIGRQGRIAKAIRTVVKAASSKSDRKVVVEILQ